MDGAAVTQTTEHANLVAEAAVVRFAGDSGDGMQLTGGRFTLATALAGNDLATFPDFPAEIRAPVGTTFGVSAFQINFGGRKIKTVGDQLDVLVAMNPAALKVNLGDLKPGGLIIADSGTFNDKNLRKAGYEENPLEDGSLSNYKLLSVDMSKLTLEAVKEYGVSNKEGLRTKNMWALGLIYWMYDRSRTETVNWLQQKFAKREDIASANVAALNAGHAFGETIEQQSEIRPVHVPPAPIDAGLYRAVTGTQAVAWGLTAGAMLANQRMVFCSYPITPASALLHTLAELRHYNVETFQAEDEIAAVCAALGASYAGSLGVTSSSGPGVALKTEALGLGISTELPLVVVNSQRGGPSTGLPTKTEQSDLFQSVWGRNGDAPLCVLATRSPSDCFETAVEAVRIAIKYMTPVILLTDGFLANASEPWKIPDLTKLEPFPTQFATDPETYQPFARDPDTLARPWAKPGTPGLEHRIGGIEKQDGTGHISYDPQNHHKMTMLRAEKIQRIADDVPEQGVDLGTSTGKLAVVGWGSTYGPISRAVTVARAEGLDVSHIHLRHIWPLPRNLKDLLSGYEQILVPEMNTGQLVKLLRAEYLLPAEGLNKISGQPFKVSELDTAIRARLS
ncbi:2-oxoacid:acceptor oxidoreductase subunit alpha [Hwanghaeella sp.]|uniref:2-oxoacid:acceptor oxidoreductase subunit alpha n=1 Tax=Hwanghaeella sp. TaxID=2605943 RepID=UPI003CCBAD63